VTDKEMRRLIQIVSKRLILKYERAISRNCVPEMTLSAFKINSLVTNDHVIKTQAELLNTVCSKVDQLRHEKRKLEKRKMRMALELRLIKAEKLC